MLAPLASSHGVSAQERWKTDFGKRTVSLEEIVSGGIPKDGIPAIDDPKFVTVAAADRWLGEREPLAVVRVGGEVKAYPLQILIWHEIVNDEVGGRNVAVTFCPLCNTTLAFDRDFKGKTLDFGTTGRLRHSDLVMYDRQTESWWQQATGEGIVGEYAGEELVFLPAPLLSWKEVKSHFPKAKILSRETGHDRDYGKNPYVGYDSRRAPFSFFKGKTDRRLPAMERIVALHEGKEAVAVPFGVLSKRRVARVRIGERDVVVFWAPGAGSVLDRAEIGQGREVGVSAVFLPRAGGMDLTFEAAGDGRFRDRETGTVWNVSGRAIKGELTGEALEPVVHGNHFWFAWVAFKPKTKIWRR